MPRRPRWAQLSLPAASPENDNDAVDALDAFVGDVALSATSPAGGSPEARVRAGRSAKRHGDAFEAWIASYLKTAQHAGVIAWWMKIHPGVRQVRRCDNASGTWRNELAWAARAAADFIALTPDGRMVAIECKSIESARLARAVIQPQQVTHLDAVAAAGGLAFLAVEFRDEGRVTCAARQYFIPWREVPWVVARTASSLTELAATPWRERRGELLARLRGS